MKPILPLVLIGTLLASSAFAETFEVQMLNKNPDNPKQRMVFVPDFLQVQPGDTVIFKATDKGHNAQSIKGMVPDGADMWKGKMNKDVSVTFSVEGLYGYKCMPHFGLGMVGTVQVGDDTSNLAAMKAKKTPPKAMAVFNRIYQKIAAQ
ncbi:hypothetical protein MNBD_ALPHA06-1024 [hydrothermal vent metagenome]|uniref:Pseudoazurin n=1 Tax=hydrothermal vent metagenome TaxID=652676 RepID=A0A3B0SKN5_9ZZZZ